MNANTPDVTQIHSHSLRGIASNVSGKCIHARWLLIRRSAMRAGRRKQQRRGRRAAIRVVGVGSACWNALGSQRSTFRQMAKDVALLASIRVAVGGMMRISFPNVVVPLVVLAVTVIWRYGVQIATMTESGAVACATLVWKILADVMPACCTMMTTRMVRR